MRGIPVTPLLWPPLGQSASCLIKTPGGNALFSGPLPVCWSASAGVNLSLHHHHHGFTHINHSKHFFQLVNVCESRYSAYHYNPLSPNPLKYILGLRLFYCISENLLVLLIPAVMSRVHYYSCCFQIISFFIERRNYKSPFIIYCNMAI